VGRIVIISSPSAQSGAVAWPLPSLSKGGVVLLTKALRSSRPHGITVNSIPPGFID
jgi:2-hydroxycyclohexanecarboxyl-CoA dehydrogenase